MARGDGAAAARTSAASRTGSACSSSSARSRAGRRGARRARRARGRGHRDPALDLGAGRRRARPVRAARLAAVRDPARAADRGDRASRRADAARSVPRLGGERRARPRSASPTTTRASATRSTAGSSRSSSRSRSAASSSVTRSSPRSAKATAPGRPRCAAPLCSARPRPSAPTSREKLREPTCELLRRLLVAVLLHGDRRALVRDLDEALLGVTARSRVSSGAPASRAQTRHELPPTFEAWRKRERFWPGWSGSRRSSARARGVPSLLAELRELVREATEWAERERDPRAQAAAAALADAGAPPEGGRPSSPRLARARDCCRPSPARHRLRSPPGTYGSSPAELASYALRARLRLRQEPAGERPPAAAARLRGGEEAERRARGGRSTSATRPSRTPTSSAR